MSKTEVFRVTPAEKELIELLRERGNMFELQLNLSSRIEEYNLRIRTFESENIPAENTKRSLKVTSEILDLLFTIDRNNPNR